MCSMLKSVVMDPGNENRIHALENLCPKNTEVYISVLLRVLRTVITKRRRYSECKYFPAIYF